MDYPMPILGDPLAFNDSPHWGRLPFRGVPPREVNAWMWDKELLNMGSFGGRMRRKRIEDPPKIEALRWRLLCRMKDKIKPAWEGALAVLDVTRGGGLYQITDEDHGRFGHEIEGEGLLVIRSAGAWGETVLYSWYHEDTKSAPLIQLAKVGALSIPRWKAGAEWIRCEKWRCDYMRKLIKVDTALMTALWYQQTKMHRERERVVFTLNGRRYPNDNLLQEVFPSAWPTPEAEEIVL